MTQAELGARLRVSDQTVARWEKDQSEKDRPADLMLRVLLLGSPLAEPEGNNILRDLIKLLDELQERDEAKEKADLFEHGQQWQDVRLVL